MQFSERNDLFYRVMHAPFGSSSRNCFAVSVMALESPARSSYPVEMAADPDGNTSRLDPVRDVIETHAACRHQLRLRQWAAHGLHKTRARVLRWERS